MSKHYLKNIIIFSVILTPFVLSQSVDSIGGIDEDYLESLPSEVREDVLKEMKLKKDDSKNLQKRPSSKLSKSEVVRDWENFKKERLLNNKSERYGIKLFNTMQSSFMPINEPNFGNNYVLDYGDFLTIYKYGSGKNEVYEIEIERDGSILLPSIGKTVLSGLNFEEASKLIKEKYQTSFIGSNVYVTLSEIRDINVLVTGGVEFPGIYTLSGNSNILQALNIVGGISENGSLRNIVLRRQGQPDKIFDLYEALIFGDLESIPTLMSGDSIYIEPVNKLVRAGYGFNNIAIFEMKDSETLADLIRFAGGLNSKVNSDSLKLVRFEESDFKTQDIMLENADKYEMINLDSVYAYEKQIGTITITGNVKYPGKYSISSSDRLLDLIERSGGYGESAYPFGASLFRNSTKELEKSFASKTYQNLVTFIASNPTSLNNSSGDSISFLLSELKNYVPSGRFIAEFDKTYLQEDIQSNIYLEDGDSIHIPSYTSNVYVFGEVGNPGSVMFRENMTLNQYIDKSGGLTRLSSSDFIFIVSPNGETSKVQINGVRRFVNQDFTIYPGSVIYVPRHIGKVDGINLYATIAPIFSSLALSIASLNSISD